MLIHEEDHWHAGWLRAEGPERVTVLIWDKFGVVELLSEDGTREATMQSVRREAEEEPKEADVLTSSGPRAEHCPMCGFGFAKQLHDSGKRVITSNWSDNGC